MLLTDAGNPVPNAEWQHYRFTLDGDLAGLDLSDVKLVMVFPDWANADGAVVRLDNVRFVPGVGPIEPIEPIELYRMLRRTAGSYGTAAARPPSARSPTTTRMATSSNCPSASAPR